VIAYILIQKKVMLKSLKYKKMEKKEKIKIYLPITTCPQDMFCVILKLIGVRPFKEALGPNEDSVDANQPSSKNNEWELVFTKSKATYRKEINDNHHRIYLNDDSVLPLPSSFDLYISEEVNGEKLNNENLLLGEYNAFSAIIGEKLVDYFGGKVVYPSQENYTCENPKYTYLKSVKDSFYSFQNSLFNEHKITIDEIVKMRKKGIAHPIDLLYLHKLDKNFLEPYLAMEELSKELPDSNQSQPSKKMKV
jgi:hypothetical protein